jgi:isochorismate synthase EntC
MNLEIVYIPGAGLLSSMTEEEEDEVVLAGATELSFEHELNRRDDVASTASDIAKCLKFLIMIK